VTETTLLQQEKAAPPRRSRFVLSVTTHGLAAFLAASLLFGIQPWAARVLSPAFGGSASVWLTSLLFFQFSVAIGYFFAHQLARFFSGRLHQFLHLICLVLVLTLFFPPSGMNAAAGDLPPSVAVLAFLMFSLGLPIMLTAATTPTLHTWLARSHQFERPYFLYAASNAGSLFGLLAYPTLIEPWFGVDDQRYLWTGIAAALAISLVGCIAIGKPQTMVVERTTTSRDPRAWRWWLFSFVPTSLLYGVTSYLTADIASVPLLWIAPLGLYLATYIVAFAKRGSSLTVDGKWTPVVLFALAVLEITHSGVPAIRLLHLCGFTYLALHFHSRLSQAKPEDGNATSFYLWVSLGGLSAGLLHSLVGPALLDGPFEYAFTLGLSLVLVPAPRGINYSTSTRRALHLLMFFTLLIIFANAPGTLIAKIVTATIMGATFWIALASPNLANAMLALFLWSLLSYPGHTRVIERHRTFYGSHTVEERQIEGRSFLVLSHGGVVHGLQDSSKLAKRKPRGYYHPSGPYGEVHHALKPSRTGVIGLGIGSIALYGKEGDSTQFFEIDPMVVQLAKASFDSLARAQGETEVVVGDGRISLAKVPNASFDLLVIDAFDSSSIPVHLLTREALQLYTEKIAPGGRLLIHTSNRALDIHRVVAGGLEAISWHHRAKRFEPDGNEKQDGAFAASWLIAAQDANALAPFSKNDGWSEVNNGVLWTDQRSSLWEAITIGPIEL
jgi:hypothetical protein